MMVVTYSNVAASLLDTYSEVFSKKAMILSMNTSFMDPLRQFEFQLTLIKLSFKLIMAMPSLDKVKEANLGNNDLENLEELYQNVLSKFEETLLILVSKELYKLQILKDMIVWMNEDDLYPQERVMMIISKVLSFASRHVKSYKSMDAPCLGNLAAELSLLCSHSNPVIAQQASLGMYHLLCVAKSQTDVFKKDIIAKKRRSSSMTFPAELDFLPKVFQEDKTEIAQRVGQSLTPPLLSDFVWNLLMKLSESDYETASQAATILKLTLEYHADKVTRVPKIVDTIYQKLCRDSTHVMNHAMLEVIALLMYAFPKKVIFQLMDYPVPADSSLILMWQAAGSEASVAPYVLKMLLLILKGKPGEAHDSSTEGKYFSLDATSMMPLAASQALCTLLPISSYRKAVAQFFPQFLMALTCQYFYSRDLKLADSSRPPFATDALRTLLTCSGLQEVDDALQKKRCWSQFSEVLYHHHSVSLLAKTLSDYNFPQFPETLHYLYKLSEDPRRPEDSVVTLLFLTEFLNNCFENTLPEEFLALYEKWIKDSNPVVSKLSLQKIVSMAPFINEIEDVYNLVLSILDVFLSKDRTVVMQAMITLRRLLEKLDRGIYSSFCSKIASNYCHLINHNCGGIRSMAIWHFGELLKDMNHYLWMLTDMIFESLVPLILYLEDTELRVAKACRYTLEICASQLNWPISFWIQDKTYSFEMIVLNICDNLDIPHWSYFTDMIADGLTFLMSSSTRLKRGSVILTGYLAKLGGHLLLTDEIEVMLEAIERVLTDEDPLTSKLARITYELLKEIASQLPSSNVKQVFRRLFHSLRFKKLRVIYYYAELLNMMDIVRKIK